MDISKEIKELKLLAVGGRLNRRVITAQEYDELMTQIIDKCEEIIKELNPKKEHKS